MNALFWVFVGVCALSACIVCVCSSYRYGFTARSAHGPSKRTAGVWYNYGATEGSGGGSEV